MRCEGKCNRGDVFCFNGRAQSGRKVMICSHCVLSLKLDPLNLDYIPDHLLPTPAHFPTQSPPNFDIDIDFKIMPNKLYCNSLGRNETPGGVTGNDACTSVTIYS